MLTYLYNTDILELSSKEAQVVAQQCNCVTKSSKGLSQAIAKKFPHADFYSKRTKNSKPGTIELAGKGKERKIIAMYSQNQPGKPTSKESSSMREEWFRECLDRIGRIKNLRSIAFPMNIGCGLAGGVWNNYEGMIRKFSKDNPRVNVIICSLGDNTDREVGIDREFGIDHYRELLSQALSKINELGYEVTSCKRCMYWASNKKWNGCVNCEVSKTLSTPLEDNNTSSDDGDESSSSDDDEEDISYSDGLDLVIDIYEDDFKGGWMDFFQVLLENGTINEINKTLVKESQTGTEIYPPAEDVFNAMLYTPLDQMKVVIIGQDPYHTPGAAMGLAFSHHSDRGTIQPSVRNIFTELEDDGFKCNRKNADLSLWASRGVFLVNTALTVRQGEANSHSNLWSQFTSQLMTHISEHCEHLVVIMWGNHAKGYSSKFDTKKHKLLTSAHPSPFSARNGFFGSKPFSKANVQLKKWGMKPVDWNLV